MDSFRHLMLAPDSARREDMVTDLSLGLIAERGLAALTVQAVAQRCGCTRQAVQQWFGGQAELRHVVATTFLRRWLRWLPVRLRAHGLGGLQPECGEVLAWCRVRLALLEHAHREEWLADLCSDHAHEERELLAMFLGELPGSDAVIAAQATLTHFCLLARKQAEIDDLPGPATGDPRHVEW